MAIEVNRFWDQVKTKHPDKIHGKYKITELDQIPNIPGIYSWHIAVDQRSYDGYFKAFKQKRYDVYMKGNLKDDFKGTIPSAFYNQDVEKIPGIDMELCEFASMVMCPPIYIGISVKLNERLKRHYSELEKVYAGKVRLKAKANSQGRSKLDTIYESSHFAQRIGHTLRNVKGLGINRLFIKTIELNTSYKWSDLQKVENYVNRTFIPIYGRK